MPEKHVRQVVAALREKFKGDAISIPIAMREEPAVTLFPSLVEPEPEIFDTTALTAPQMPGLTQSAPHPLDQPSQPSETPTEASEGSAEEDLFGSAELDELKL